MMLKRMWTLIKLNLEVPLGVDRDKKIKKDLSFVDIKTKSYKIKTGIDFIILTQQILIDIEAKLIIATSRIVLSLSADIECTIMRLKPVVLAPRCRRYGLKKLVLIFCLYIFIFVESWI